MTPKQAKLMAYIRSCGDVCPSYEQMAAHLGLTSKGNISRMVEDMVKRGHLRRTKARNRNLVIPQTEVLANVAQERDRLKSMTQIVLYEMEDDLTIDTGDWQELLRFAIHG